MDKATVTGKARGISFDPSATVIIKGINVQAALEELDKYVTNLELLDGSGVLNSNGLSAYQIWLSEGNTGTEQDFLASLVGPAGADGADGADGLNGSSAYEIWLSEGNTGTTADFLTDLVGPPGADGADGTNGTNGTDGVDGTDGLSAYQIWLGEGNVGTEQQFLASLTGAKGDKGDPGNPGAPGADGNTTAEIAQAENATGTATGPITGVSGALAVEIPIPNTTLVVPVSTRPVWIDAFFMGSQTVAGAGWGYLELWETTTTPTFIARTPVVLPNTTAATVRNVPIYMAPIRLGVVAAQRTFELRLNIYGNGAAPKMSVLNLNALGFKTWFRALST